ncbi:MAG: hypothetical protein K1X75_10425 [Leptospirales bacterium]|nr:hypothetical protein [Leptospirales bacterium]
MPEIYRGPFGHFMSFAEMESKIRRHAQVIRTERMSDAITRQILRTTIEDQDYIVHIYNGHTMEFFRWNRERREYDGLLMGITYAPNEYSDWWFFVMSDDRTCKFQVFDSFTDGNQLGVPAGAVLYEWNCVQKPGEGPRIWTEILGNDGKIYAFTDEHQIVQATADKCWLCNPQSIPGEFVQTSPDYLFNLPLYKFLFSD